MPLDQTADEPAAETAAKTRDSYTYDAATMTITGAGGTYTFSALTPAQKDAYALRGIALSLRGYRSPDKIAAEIASGKLPGRPAKKERAPTILERAIAKGLVARSKKTEVPATYEVALGIAVGLSAKDQKAWISDADVARELRDLTPAEARPNLLSLLG